MLIVSPGYILQEEEGNGIPKEQNVGTIEGGGSAGDARPDWATRTWTKTMRNERGEGLYNTDGAYGRRFGF